MARPDVQQIHIRPMPNPTVRVTIEVPRGGHRKRAWSPGGLITEYVSPVPSPFNYGCVRDRPSSDGDPLDAVVLGPRRAPGAEVVVVVRGVVRFTDAGQADPKLVCAGSAVSDADRRTVERFFRRYAVARRLLNRLQGLTGETAFLGVDWHATGV